MKKNPYHYAILGDGPGATAMLLQSMQLLKHALNAGVHIDPSQIEITVIGRNKVPGPGFPFNPETTPIQAMANSLPEISAITYVQDPDNAELKPRQDFLEWYKKNWTKADEWFPGITAAHPTLDFSPSPDHFYPRVIYGKYFAERFQDALKMAEEMGIKVNVLSQCEITDIEQRNNHGRERLKITYKDLASGEEKNCYADHGTMATGHWQEQKALARDTRIIPSTLPVKELNGRINAVKNEKPKTDIAIIGTSLSAHDTLFQLLDAYGSWKKAGDGKPVFEWKSKERVSVALLSRHGLLPKVRGRRDESPNPHFNDDNLNKCRTLTEMKALADKELEYRYGRPMDWQEALHPSAGSRETLRRDIQVAKEGDIPGGYVGWQTVFTKPGYDIPFNHLSAAEQKEWYDQWNTTFLMYASPMTPYNAERLLHLMDAGIVAVEAVGKAEITQADKNVVVKAASGQTHRYDYMIQSTGQTRDFSKAGTLGDHAINKDHLAEAVTQSGGQRYKVGGLQTRLDTLALHRRTGEGPPYDVEPLETIDAYGAHTIGNAFWSSAVIDVAQNMKRLASEFVYRVADRQEVGSSTVRTAIGPKDRILKSYPHGNPRIGAPDREDPDPFPGWTHAVSLSSDPSAVWNRHIQPSKEDARRQYRAKRDAAREQYPDAPKEPGWRDRAASAGQNSDTSPTLKP